MIDYSEIKRNDNTPQKIMEYQFNVVHNRNWKTYLASIEWDEPVILTEEEKIEMEKERQWNAHPFKDFIDKNSILL